jgi:alkylation response protein AidB-like acyl-CoA dehydrogenase
MEAEDAGAARGAEAIPALAAMAKLTASENAMWIADEAVQIFGGYGYMRDYPVEKLMRDAKGTEIYEGTSEIMRLVIAREILKEARDG